MAKETVKGLTLKKRIGYFSSRKEIIILVLRLEKCESKKSSDFVKGI